MSYLSVYIKCFVELLFNKVQIVSSSYRNFEEFTRKWVKYEKMVKEESRYRTSFRLEEIQIEFGKIVVVEQ